MTSLQSLRFQINRQRLDLHFGSVCSTRNVSVVFVMSRTDTAELPQQNCHKRNDTAELPQQN